jgi:hypothetical protein
VELELLGALPWNPPGLGFTTHAQPEAALSTGAHLLGPVAEALVQCLAAAGDGVRQNTPNDSHIDTLPPERDTIVVST